MEFHANYRGEEKQWQRWIFSIFDNHAKNWVYVADNSGAKSWRWKYISKPLTEPKRFINEHGEIQVKFYTTGFEDSSQLDFLAITTRSAQNPVPTPNPIAKPVPVAQPQQPVNPIIQTTPIVKRITLEEVKHWVYNIQHVSTAANIEALVGSHFDMYVLEPTRSEKNENFNMKKLVKDIREYNIQNYHKDPIILAYVDIGQAEEWRWYFGDDWQIGNPYWLVANDPNGWDGNYPVAYWNPVWHNIMYKGYYGTSSVKQTLEDGFDGIYMDWVEAFSDKNVITAARIQGKNPANEMFRLIEGIRDYARNFKSDYLIVAQNAPDLFQEDPTRYVNVIDAIAEEAVWFEGNGGFDKWGDTKGYNIPTNSMYPGWTEEALKYLVKIKQHMPVFIAEYAQDLDGKEYASKVYNELAPRYGFIPYCTQRSLQKISTSPYPIGYSPIDY